MLPFAVLFVEVSHPVGAAMKQLNFNIPAPDELLKSIFPGSVEPIELYA